MANSGTLRLKYLFNNQTQLVRHAHLLEGERFALFYPDASIAAFTQRPAILQLGFTDTRQSLSLRGKVMSRTVGNQTVDGVWIEFPEKKLLRTISTQLLAERASRRYETEVLVRVSNGSGGSMMGKLIDVSGGGARLAGVPRVKVGDLLSLSLMLVRENCPTQLGKARVVSESRGELGLECLADDVLARRAMSRLYESVAREWEALPTVGHPAGCCVRGQVLQPTLPRVRELIDKAG